MKFSNESHRSGGSSNNNNNNDLPVVVGAER